MHRYSERLPTCPRWMIIPISQSPRFLEAVTRKLKAKNACGRCLIVPAATCTVVRPNLGSVPSFVLAFGFQSPSPDRCQNSDTKTTRLFRLPTRFVQYLQVPIIDPYSTITLCYIYQWPHPLVLFLRPSASYLPASLLQLQHCLSAQTSSGSTSGFGTQTLYLQISTHPMNLLSRSLRLHPRKRKGLGYSHRVECTSKTVMASSFSR